MSTARRAAAISAAALAALLLGATGSADAFHLGGARWPGRTITYHDQSPNPAAVRLAVRTWNRSGARIRFKPAARARADVLIVRYVGGACSGFAQIGYAPGYRAQAQLAPCKDGLIAGGIAVHELGHILGLNHEDGRCAAMNSVLEAHCKHTPAYEGRCRLLERDDVRGVVRLYGGRVRPVRRSAFCPVWSAPKAASGLTVTGGDTGADALRLHFTAPAQRRLQPALTPSPPVSGVLYRYRDACPSGRPARRPDWSVYVQPGHLNAIDAENRLDLAPGRWCYALWLEDAMGRRSPAPATATFLVRRVGPTAVIGAVDPDPGVAGEPVFLSEASDRGESRELTWHWDFGDTADPGATSAEPYAEHTYTQPGTYTVTLTVTNELGQSSTATRTVRIDPAPPPPDPT